MAVGISTPESPTLLDQDGLPAGTATGPLFVPDDGLYELVDGKLVEKKVGAQQVEIANTLAFTITSFVRPLRLGRALVEMVFRIDPARNLQRRPDAAFVSDARWAFRKRVPDVPVWDMVPDLAIEVNSPNNSADEIQDKRLEYFRAGVKQVWVIYPKQREAHIYTSPTEVTILTADDELDGGEIIPGFRLRLSVLFDDEPGAE